MKLYIDFDGVILNTIEVSYKRIKEKYGQNATMEESSEFYRSINWNNFINECSPINDSIKHLKKIIESQKYDVTVLTHVLSDHEQEAKEKYLEKEIPGIKIIAVKKPAPKWEAADCYNAILVDDFSENLYDWQEHGGFPIKFSQKDKKYSFMTIDNLEMLLTMYDTIKEKMNNKKLLTKNKNS